MNRRKFLATSAATTGAALVTSVTDHATLAAPLVTTPGAPVRSFKLNYAPHFGMFKHHTGPDRVAQLQFFREQGFTALECNELPTFPVADQELVGKTLADLKMTMGVFVANKDFENPTFAVTTWQKDKREPILKEMREAVEIAKRANAKTQIDCR